MKGVEVEMRHTGMMCIIGVRSGQAKKILQETAQCHYKCGTNRLLIDPLELYLFHHHAILAGFVRDHPGAGHYISELIGYCHDHFLEDFTIAEALISSGRISREHLPKLFKPNDIIVVTDPHGQAAAYAINEWPKVNRDGSLDIKCWSFYFDGNKFSRKPETFPVTSPADNFTEITTLDVVPLQYVSAETRKKLVANGSKQWILRRATQVMYRGWNVNRDEFYVRATLSFRSQQLMSLARCKIHDRP